MTQYQHFPPSAEWEEITKALDEIPAVPGERALGVMLPDGSYHIVGSIIKADDCPLDVFDRAIELLAEHASK